MFLEDTVRHRHLPLPKSGIVALVAEWGTARTRTRSRYSWTLSSWRRRRSGQTLGDPVAEQDSVAGRGTLRVAQVVEANHVQGRHTRLVGERLTELEFPSERVGAERVVEPFGFPARNDMPSFRWSVGIRLGQSHVSRRLRGARPGRGRHKVRGHIQVW